MLGSSLSEIDVSFDSNILASDSVYSTEGVRIELDGSPLAISSMARKNITSATITLSSPLTSGVVGVYIGYGKGATAAALTYPRSENIVLSGTGGTYNLTSLPADAIEFSVSSVTLSVTGIPDATPYKTILFNGSAEVFNDSLTYTSGLTTTPALSVAVGVALTGYVIDNEATHVDGAVITGTTV